MKYKVIREWIVDAKSITDAMKKAKTFEHLKVIVEELKEKKLKD